MTNRSAFMSMSGSYALGELQYHDARFGTCRDLARTDQAPQDVEDAEVVERVPDVRRPGAAEVGDAWMRAHDITSK